MASSSDDKSNATHERISALFLGPKAENADFLVECFKEIVHMQVRGRQAYFPNDAPFITEDIKTSEAFVKQREHAFKDLQCLLYGLEKSSIPFYSPRYSAHMCVDQSLPAILGYLSTMFYNPNNVAFEASPITTRLEIDVGEDLCEMMGYTVDHSKTGTSWGHITCDGTVANLESIWASRNLKFYPLSLRDAMDDELSFISDTFKVETCVGETKLLKNLSTWELLNLRVSTVLAIPERLQQECDISATYLDSVMKKYIIQSISKDVLMDKWHIKNQPVIFVPSTKHYSWPKGAAIAGLGSDSCQNIAVDFEARMKIDELRSALQACLDNEQAVLEVVAVMGTTEEGAVDRLKEIVELRTEFEEKGLSFVVHADAAWGGYFASMVPHDIMHRDPRKLPKSDPDFVPQVRLRKDTVVQLLYLKLADSITVDPHKAGYVPYPAGSLCYKDGRMRYLLTWTAPYIHQSTEGESIGVYGVEGSKPGAAAAAVYLSHQVIGLDECGMGSLLGEASFTCRRFASYWAAMTDDTMDYVVIPLNLLPSERKGPPNPDDVEKERAYIRENILPKDNSSLVEDEKAMRLLNELGSDLNINAFAVNFRYPDGTLNTSIEEANWLNRRIFEALSVTNPNEDPRAIPFYLTSTTFAEADYGECADRFKARLGLEGKQDLFVLRNVVMSPFTTTYDFMPELIQAFTDVVEKEVKHVVARNTVKPEQHTFLAFGSDKLYFVHQPSFHMASGRCQLIFTADVSQEDKNTLESFSSAGDGLTFMQNIAPISIDEIKDGFAFDGEIYSNSDTGGRQPIKLENVTIIKKRPLDSKDLDSSYPKFMPFYLYGSNAEMHLEHALLLAPNIQLSAGRVSGSFDTPLTDSDLAIGLIAVATNVHEQAMQPFPPLTTQTVDFDTFFFRPGKQLDVVVYKDPYGSTSGSGPERAINLKDLTDVVARGTVTVDGAIFIDSKQLNEEDDDDAEEHPLQFTASGRMKARTAASWAESAKELRSSFRGRGKGARAGRARSPGHDSGYGHAPPRRGDLKSSGWGGRFGADNHHPHSGRERLSG